MDIKRLVFFLVIGFSTQLIFAQQTEKKRKGIHSIEDIYEKYNIKKLDKTFPYNIDLKTAEGEIFNSADILAPDGKPLVLLFWLTTCVPCGRELAAIAGKYENWQQEADFRLIAISTDFPKRVPAFVERVKKSDWPFEAFHDFNREFFRVMPGELNGLPQTFVFDREGNIVYQKRKYSPGDENALFEKVKEVSEK
ncbi:MAG: peroxiredoxin family protein [Bacteroidetes bacterium]|nr:peroxiredoxin family protein [Bacteroidota bacterium]